MVRDSLQELKRRLKIKRSLTIHQLTKQVILHTFDQMYIKAFGESGCKYMTISSSILEIDLLNEMVVHFAAINKPNSKRNKCSGLKNCECSHAEARVIIRYLKGNYRQHRKNVKTILISTKCPCINCANIIMDTELIDVVAYDGLYNSHEGSGFKILDKSFDIRLWTKNMIEKDIENKRIKNWLLKN